MRRTPLALAVAITLFGCSTSPTPGDAAADAAADMMDAAVPTPGVGDRCLPETVPEGGFLASEIYLETSSASCRTRVCLTYQFEGDPRETRESCVGTPAECSALPTDADVLAANFCSCRCDAPDGSPECICGPRFHCETVITAGGPAIEGGYCVRD